MDKTSKVMDKTSKVMDKTSIKKGLPQQAPLVILCVWSFESEQLANLLSCVQVEDGLIGEACDHVAEALDLLTCLAHVDDAESVLEGL